MRSTQKHFAYSERAVKFDCRAILLNDSLVVFPTMAVEYLLQITYTRIQRKMIRRRQTGHTLDQRRPRRPLDVVERGLDKVVLQELPQ